MSIKNYKEELQIEELNCIIENIRRVKKRLENIELDLIELQANKEELLRKM